MKERQSQDEGVAEKRPRTEKIDTETETGGEAGTSQSPYKKASQDQHISYGLQQGGNS